MKSFFLATFALAITMVFGQANPVYITAPLTGASYTAGATILIRWINPVAETITQIVLAKGISTNIQAVSTVASNVATSTGSFSWTIPADLPAGTDYAFALGTSPDVAYTGQFTINAASGDATTTTTAAGSSTASASSTASGSASISASANVTSSAISSVASAVSSVVVSSMPSAAPSAAPSVSKPVSVSRSVTSPVSSPTLENAAMSTKASVCAIAMTAFAALALL
ncbi:Ser-Thr-rich glycosyl-phosphatidyl-inositol-anchored membrane family-domain-containing protein [Helicostylum pulchrum]|uniref:Yeast cell wall synthesis Kre9/Knh1-like N-terminal domain-containing protein n=1 Tax=Helicostylum pulchrum TaxID=562976 RepID=A0ABP9YD50_9FUNG|nr:Ser-Thr-rich glycosyl-phosphatidyl-inositol-anchored membrane family-domain-containing protein [Helicostylum pulchrum]